MSVVAKAIELLWFFSAETPEIGLSQLCRKAGRDKATTYRHLTSLEKLGLVEQNPITKAYRIGPAVLHLAQVREATVPRREGALGPLRKLAEASGETSHVSVLSGQALHSLIDCESTLHSTRAVIDLQQLPLHATASGICALAFGPANLMDFACVNLTQFTAHTTRTVEALQETVSFTKTTGIGVSDRGLEDDIYGLAVPIFDQTGLLAGTVAVASVASRITFEHGQNVRRQLVHTSKEITHNWGGTVPASIEANWDATLANTNQWDTAE